jgi:vacuolar protein sorting-associated protein 72
MIRLHKAGSSIPILTPKSLLGSQVRGSLTQLTMSHTFMLIYCTEISSSLCVITSLPSRYRDPGTSLPFANSYAYHEIRHTAAQKYAWSPMLGCYVGPTGVAARGVPEKFLNPNAKESSPKAGGGSDDLRPPTKKEDVPKTESGNPTATPVTLTPAAAGAGDAMDIDK